MSRRQLLVAAGVAVALLVVPTAVADPPTWTSFPANVNVSVENGSTGIATWANPTAEDSSLNPIPSSDITCNHSSGETFSLGPTPVTCTATDSSTPPPNTKTDLFVVDVSDPTPPTFDAHANVSVEVEGNVGGNATFVAPAASDAGGSIGAPTCDRHSEDTFPYGTTAVRCTVSDGGGNAVGPTQVFTVTVADTTVPTITVPGNMTVPSNSNASSAPVTYSPAPTASDAGGPISAPACSPASGSSFAVNVLTTVNCNVSDGANSAVQKSFKVLVQDNTAPVITVPGPIGVNINNATSASVPYTATALDGSTPMTPTCAPASGSIFPLGVSTVTCNATDAGENAAVPKSFTITVADTTSPAIAVTGGPPALTNLRTASLDFTTSEGTTTCQLDGGGFAPCTSPALYSGLADGSHTFTVKATDAASNSATATRTWSIDATPPVLSLPSTRYNEANGPQGAIASFTVSAADSGGALLPSAITCSPGSGSLFPMGETSVSCRVTDSAGNTASGTFLVVVQDTTPPAINAPNVSFTATSANGTLKTDPDVAAYLAGVSATDLVSTPTLTNNMPNVLPIGATTVVFTATDAAGNTAKKSVTATVLAVGKKAPSPDFTPPGEVLSAVAKLGDRLVTLSWKLPSAKDLGSIVVTRSVVGGPAVGREIYNGLGTTVTAKGLVNGTTYRFLIVAFDKSGNRSKGVILLATPESEALTSPTKGQRVTKPPLLRWVTVPAATYYNVQLWRGSTKVLSTWPAATRFQVTAKWTFGSKPRKLSAGLYTWYVWPGLGPRAVAKYGSLLGSRTFVYVMPKPKR